MNNIEPRKMSEEQLAALRDFVADPQPDTRCIVGFLTTLLAHIAHQDEQLVASLPRKLARALIDAVARKDLAGLAEALVAAEAHLAAKEAP